MSELRKRPDQRRRDIGDARRVIEEFMETGTDTYGFVWRRPGKRRKNVAHGERAERGGGASPEIAGGGVYRGRPFADGVRRVRVRDLGGVEAERVGYGFDPVAIWISYLRL